MTALAAATNLKTSERGKTDTFVVKNSQALYHGGLVGLDANGVLVPWDDTAVTNRFLGIFDAFEPALTSGAATTTGNTSATPAVRGRVRTGGETLRGVDVAGVTARANIGEPVYGTTDNHTDLTLTPTAFVKPIGRLVDFRSTSDMDVKLFTPDEYHAYGSHAILSFPILLATIADGDLLTTITPGVRGRIVKWWAAATAAASTASKASTLNLEVGTTDATGGTLALTTAGLNALGKVVAQGAAFTAGTAFGAADTLSIEAASTTTFIEGSIVIHIVLQLDE